MTSRVVPLLGGPLALACAATLVCAQDPLPSWNDGHAKQRIVAFVTAVTNPAGTDFVPPADRIAVFDNDGTLWSEQPVYVQLAFALDRIKALAPQHPEWKQQQPFRGVLEGDLKSAAASGERGLLQMMMATHAGMTSDEFARTVETWLAAARHPRFERPYPELVYQPMLELLAYLRGAGFKTYIVSGGGVEFMRVFAERRYGVPPEQVIGSTIRTRYEVRNGTPTIVRLPEVDFVDDGAGKPAGIHKLIGRRPIAAFGNSDGDFEMLEWATAAPGPRLGLIVHHEDAAREYAYDRGSPIGRLQRSLDEGPRRGWTIVSMKADWKRIFPFEP
ncbi:MAG TPA: HAD family hydrolase [Rubrivivax sp.]|nr:HAD family hydrolase [Burkholderiaceae bacterium]HRY89451.1 HAD family hydrolase [Rubrivivax sp.]HRZ62037.1 HAD family hydrolase [Rubrivivax sp.]